MLKIKEMYKMANNKELAMAMITIITIAIMVITTIQKG